LGARIENNATIFEISDTRKLWVLLDAMEKDLQYIEKNKDVTVVSDVYPDEVFSGRVLTIMEKIDPELRTVKVRVEVDNPTGRLKPEMYVRGRLEKTLRGKNLAIPVSSLVKVSGVDGVFVIETDGFLFRAVQVIEIDSAGFAFVKGLIEEDLVISEGAFYLKAEYEIQRGGGTDPHAGHTH
jgi:Cu(I)/Ag(I) efflux system membrane fusion protein